MAVIITPTPVGACQAFTVTVTGAPLAATQAVFTYDGQPPVTVPLTAGSASVTLTATGSGAQTVSVVYLDATSTVVGAENGTVTVTPAPAGTLSTTLTTPVGGITTATTVITCAGGLTSINGTLTYTLPGGATVTATVTNGVVLPTNLGVALTPGQTVGVSFTPAAGSCPACTLAPITVTVPPLSTCTVAIQSVVGSVIVGQPLTVTAVVLCNGQPVSGATVTFTGGATPVTATTNASGIATGTLVFNTPGTATVTATVTATGTACSCTGVISAPVTITVAPQPSCQVMLLPAGPTVVGQPTTVTAVVLCNGQPVSGATVTFTGGATPVTATTNASGIATGSLVFNTPGTATVTATVTASGTTCSCTGVISAPLTITVNVRTRPTPQASPACWRVNTPLPVPDLFTATLTATLTPAQAGVTVSFYILGQLVGTAVTNASGVATLNAGLSLLQISAASYTATATVGGVTVQATGSLVPCPPM
ncbi:hypothetical protein [Streptomyces sp. NPDC020742]|uniref:hypothetical protein n=1 Tax=Streptomyces sp. NPDC020742 TaxID=3154897 RepID=UPI00340838BE